MIKTMKKTVISLIVVLIFGMMNICGAMADDAEFVISLDKTELSPNNNSLEAIVDFAPSEVIKGVQGIVAYNRDVLEVERVEKGAVLIDGLVGDIDYTVPGKIAFSIVYSEPTQRQGNLCKVLFKLKNTTNSKKSEVRVKNVKIVDLNNNNKKPNDVYQYFDIVMPEKNPTPSPAAPPNPIGGGTSGPVSSAAPIITPIPEPTAEPVFDDVAGHWAEDDIKMLYLKGIVNGVTKNKFEPDRSITRAEFTKLVSVMLDLNVAMPNVFEDVAEDSWYRPYVMLAYTANLITGDGGYFRPNDNMTRTELAVIADRVCKYKGIETTPNKEVFFEDDSEIQEWAKENVYGAAGLGIVQGSENKFNPKSYTTRAQTAAVIRRLYNLINVK